MRVALLAILTLALLGGCLGGDDDQVINWATHNMAFAIVWPADGQVVNARAVEVKGVGLPDGSHSFWCRVYTNAWYGQPGDVERSPNGSWRTTAYLGGEGHYNNHIIEVGAVLPDGSEVRSRVTGIVVR